MLIDETVHCKNIFEYNDSEKTNKKREYTFVFKGTEIMGDEPEEDLVEEATDFILDLEVDMVEKCILFSKREKNIRKV